MQIRDWLYVEDHACALYLLLRKGNVGESYNIGGNNEKTNLDVVESICNLLDELVPNMPRNLASYKNLITHIPDSLAMIGDMQLIILRLKMNWAGFQKNL